MRAQKGERGGVGDTDATVNYEQNRFGDRINDGALGGCDRQYWGTLGGGRALHRRGCGDRDGGGPADQYDGDSRIRDHRCNDGRHTDDR